MGMTTSKNLYAKPEQPPKVGAGAEVPARPSSPKARREPLDDGEGITSRKRLEPMDDGEADLLTREQRLDHLKHALDHPAYDETEQQQIARIFSEMLAMPTRDGGKKRTKGLKVPWWRDPTHLPAIFSHLRRFFNGELADPDSGAHPLVHAAWRCLAIAYQDTQGKVNPNYKPETPGLIKHASDEKVSNGLAHLDPFSK